MEITPDVQRDLHRRMVRIRRFEERAGKLVESGDMPGFLHLYVGQEAVAAGVCSALTDAAIARGVFGVPTFGCDGRLFWGDDALPMLRAALAGEAFFDGPAWEDAGRDRPGVVRRT